MNEEIDGDRTGIGVNADATDCGLECVAEGGRALECLDEGETGIVFNADARDCGLEYVAEGGRAREPQDEGEALGLRKDVSNEASISSSMATERTDGEGCKMDES